MSRSAQRDRETFAVITAVAEMALVLERTDLEAFQRLVAAPKAKEVVEELLRQRDQWEKYQRIAALSEAFVAFYAAAEQFFASGKEDT